MKRKYQISYNEIKIKYKEHGNVIAAIPNAHSLTDSSITFTEFIFLYALEINMRIENRINPINYFFYLFLFKSYILFINLLKTFY